MTQKQMAENWSRPAELSIPKKRVNVKRLDKISTWYEMKFVNINNIQQFVSGKREGIKT